MSMEFRVVNATRHDRFEETVTDLLNDGWELHGSPFISQTGGMTQALIRSLVSKKSENKKVSK